MSSSVASELARRLAQDAEAVCRRYLSNGRRCGRLLARRRRPQYAGPLPVCAPERQRRVEEAPPANGSTPRRASMAICSTSSAIRCNLSNFGDVLDEARRFLNSLRCDPAPTSTNPTSHLSDRLSRSRRDDSSICRARSRARWRKPISDIAASRLCTKRARFAFIHAATIGPIDIAPTQTLPALIAAVTDARGDDHRRASHLARSVGPGQGADRNAEAGDGPAARSMASGSDRVDDVMAAGEGIETMLSLRCALPRLPMIAALSAAHLAAPVAPADFAPPLHRARQ